MSSKENKTNSPPTATSTNGKQLKIDTTLANRDYILDPTNQPSYHRGPPKGALLRVNTFRANYFYCVDPTDQPSKPGDPRAANDAAIRPRVDTVRANREGTLKGENMVTDGKHPSEL